MRQEAGRAAAAVSGVAAVAWIYASWLHVSNPTTVALTFLLIVLIAAATSRLWVALVTSVAAMLCLNLFFLPPLGTLAIADPQNWVAVSVFLAVSVVASHLSAVARARATDATARRDELGRLFDLSRDVLLVTGGTDAVAALAKYISRRFDIEYVAICLSRDGKWEIAAAGRVSLTLNHSQLTAAFTSIEKSLELGAREGMYAGHRVVPTASYAVRLVPLRLGARPIGLLAAAGPIESGALDAIAGVASLAIERVQLLEDRRSAELARKSEEMKSALLASLGHDLRTPLTAIRVAGANLQASWLGETERREQSDIVLTEVARLTRLFENILEMARLDAGTVGTDLQWVHPATIVEAARDQVGHAVARQSLRVTIDCTRLVRVDPRLTAASLAHLLENAGQYAPAGSEIEVRASVGADELALTVRDHGPGISAQDLPHVFERFYRGVEARARPSGTGMGLAIARGLLAVERGRVWAENCPDGGAQFTIAVPAETKILEAVEQVQ
jgi:two-component system sensor histidine kinase KdpD